MDREKQSLEDMGAFVEVNLPKGEKAIGLKWVYQNKTDAEGLILKGTEKACLVAQGCNQCPGQYDKTYAPVAKMVSVCILIAWAAVNDLKLFQFDCKTAFLHAKLRHPLYARPFPGYQLNTPGKVLHIMVALYGMIRCEVDHGVFYGEWSSPPHPSIAPQEDGKPLVLYVLLHFNDGLAITNSTSLYQRFLATLAKQLLIVDLGPCSKFLGILIIQDRPSCCIWLSSHVYIAELLHEWKMTNCKCASTPFPYKVNEMPVPLSNSLPDVTDEELTVKYQWLVKCLLYLAIATRPDISYYTMWLGQYNTKLNRSHLLAAKHILRYLAGTKDLALTMGSPSPSMPGMLSAYIQNVGCSDADWVSDAMDRKSISGYSFYFEGSLVSWSAVKQKSIALSSTEAEYYAMTHAFKLQRGIVVASFLRFSQTPSTTTISYSLG